MARSVDQVVLRLARLVSPSLHRDTTYTFNSADFRIELDSDNYHFLDIPQARFLEATHGRAKLHELLLDTLDHAVIEFKLRTTLPQVHAQYEFEQGIVRGSKYTHAQKANFVFALQPQYDVNTDLRVRKSDAQLQVIIPVPEREVLLQTLYGENREESLTVRNSLYALALCNDINTRLMERGYATQNVIVVASFNKQGTPQSFVGLPQHLTDKGRIVGGVLGLANAAYNSSKKREEDFTYN